MKWTLKGYVANKNMTLKEFSEMLGYNPHYMYNICNGKARPSRRLIKQILEFTEGLVNMDANPRIKASKVYGDCYQNSNGESREVTLTR